MAANVTPPAWFDFPPPSLIHPGDVLASFRPYASPPPTAADLDTADRIAWDADGGDPDDNPGPLWRHDVELPAGEIELEPGIAEATI